MDERRIFSDFSIRECEDFEECAKTYIEYFNERRPTFALGYLTPKQFTEKFYGSWNEHQTRLKQKTSKSRQST